MSFHSRKKRKTSANSPPQPPDPSLLITAAAAGQHERVQELLSLGVPPDSQDREGYSPLAMAAICGHKNVVKLLLEAKAQPDAIHPDLSKVKDFLDFDTSPVRAPRFLSRNLNYRNEDDTTPLLWAIRCRNAMLVKALLYAGASTDAGYSPMEQCPLVLAASLGCTEIVQLLLDAGAQVNTVYSDTFTPLLLTASRGHTSIVKILLAAGASQKTAHLSGLTPLLVATRKGFDDIVRELLAQSTEGLDWHDSKGMSALIWAVQHKQIAVVRMLLDARADVYPQPSAPKKYNLLNMALESDSLDLTKLLLAAKANPNDYASTEKPPLLLATARGLAPIVDELLKAKADVEVKCGRSISAMDLAIESQNLDVIQLLAAAKANVSVDLSYRGGRLMTPLMLAVKRNDVAVLKTLIKAGAPLDSNIAEGVFPLLQAVRNGNFDCVKALISAKARLDIRDENGETALRAAAGEGSIAIVRELLCARADVNACDMSYRTPLFFASTPQVTFALIDAQADLNARDEFGCTPLMHAAENGRSHVVMVLLKAGAGVNDKCYIGESPILKSLRRCNATTAVDAETVCALLNAKADVSGFDRERRSALLLAATHPTMNLLIMKQLLEAGAPVNSQDSDGETALMAAISDSSLVVPSLLISHRADVDIRNRMGHTALVKAARQGLTPVVKLLLDAGARWDSRHPAEANALAYVCRYDIYFLKSLSRTHNFTEHDVFPGDKNYDSDYCYLAAEADEDDEDGDVDASEDVDIQDSSLELLGLLVNAKADLNPARYSADAPLIAAVERPYVLRFLINSKAQVDLRGPRGETALIAAARKEASRSVGVLLQAKADVNATDYRNYTAFKYAVDMRDIPTLKQLVTAGAHPEVGYAEQATPLLKPLSFESTSVVRLLLKAKADVAKITRYHANLLKEAIEEPEILQALVDAGLDLSHSSNIAAHLLKSALQETSTKILRLLIKARAPIDAVNPYDSGKTALMNALTCPRVNRRIVETLLSAGARVDACISDTGETALSCDAVNRDPVLLKHLLRAHCLQTGHLDPLKRAPQNEDDSVFASNDSDIESDISSDSNADHSDEDEDEDGDDVDGDEDDDDDDDMDEDEDEGDEDELEGIIEWGSDEDEDEDEWYGLFESHRGA